MTGSLSGLLVADFSRVLAGPYATMLLADHGAQVIKVEPPTGDPTRRWGPPFADDGQTTYFHSINRNKRSVVLDLKNRDDRQLAHELATRADIVVENFRPGTMDEHGLGYGDLSTDNPKLIYCSISGFGTNQGAALPGFDLLVQATGGLMSITGPPGQPHRTGVAVVDVLTGLHALTGILAAVNARHNTGRGQLIQVNLLSSLLSGLVNQSSAWTSGHTVPEAEGNEHPSITPYQVYDTADEPIVIAVGTDEQFVALTQSINRPELADDPRYLTNTDRNAHRHELNLVLTKALASDTARNWQERLTAASVPAGGINSIDQAFQFAEELGLAPIETLSEPDGQSVATVRNPVTMSDSSLRYDTAPPPLGADSEAIRQWLSASDA